MITVDNCISIFAAIGANEEHIPEIIPIEEWRFPSCIRLAGILIK